MTRSEHEPGDSDGKRETPRARAAWIDEENTLTLFDERPVGVTGKHCREPRGYGLETELPEVMNHVEGMGPDLDHIIGGCSEAHGPLSLLPRTARTGATARSASRTARAPMSPQ